MVFSPFASMRTARSVASLATVSRSDGDSLTVKPFLPPAVFRQPTTSWLVGVPVAAPPSANDVPPFPLSPPPSSSPPHPAISAVAAREEHRYEKSR